jgi:DNA-binding transcriptional LysR family regulator
VAQHGSISRAAIELGSDQSTVSRQIARLEAQAETRLFHRSGRGVVLTPAGQALLEHAKRVVQSLDDAQQAMREFAAQGPAQVVIAAQPTIAQCLFGPLGLALRRLLPNTRVRFVEGLGSHMLTWLAAGEIDIAVFYLPGHAGGLKVDLLMKEAVYLVASTAHSAVGAEFPVRKLDDLGLVLPSTPHGLRLLAESLTEKAGVRLKVALECDGSTALTKRLVAAGCGHTLLPLASVAEEVAQGKLQAARLVDPPVHREIAIATSRNRPALPELWDITQLIRQEATAVVESGGWPGASLLAPQNP